MTALIKGLPGSLVTQVPIIATQIAIDSANTRLAIDDAIPGDDPYGMIDSTNNKVDLPFVGLWRINFRCSMVNLDSAPDILFTSSIFHEDDNVITLMQAIMPAASISTSLFVSTDVYFTDPDPDNLSIYFTASQSDSSSRPLLVGEEQFSWASVQYLKPYVEVSIPPV